jgi:SET domain
MYWLHGTIFLLGTTNLYGLSQSGQGFGASSSHKQQRKRIKSSISKSSYDVENSESLSRLTQWLLDMECEGLGSEAVIEIGRNRNTGIRGVFAKEDLKAGEYLLAIPFPAALVVVENEQVEIDNENDNENNNNSNDLTTRIITDAERGFQLWKKYLNPGKSTTSSATTAMDIPWSPYLEMLPKRLGSLDFDPTPDFWSVEEIAQLEFPRIVTEAIRRKKLVEEMAFNTGIPYEDLQFATWLAKSRCFSLLRSTGCGSVTTNKSVLIPFLDMINHSSCHSNVELQLVESHVEEESFYTILTTKPITAGSEIFLSYGTNIDSSVELLLNYGIVEVTNRNDVAMLQKGGLDCWNRIEDWSTTLKDDEKAIQEAKETNLKTALAFRIGMKRAIQDMNKIKS